jgi:phenylacetate-coenzyme A ligase PaaK-like adenylate-forming protein
MLTALYGRLIQPFHERVWHGRRTFRYLAELEASQWHSSRELADRQFDSLRRLLTYARDWCPYYADQWERLGLDPAAVLSLEDYSRWPLLTREMIRAHRDRMRSTQSGLKVFSKATGGSSGEPLQFDLNMESHARRVAASHRGYGWAGAGPGTRQFFLWSIPMGNPPWWERARLRLFEAIQRRKVVNLFRMGRETIPEFVRELNSNRPHAIVAYSNALYTFARELRDRRMTPFRPKTIVVGAEKLHPHMRATIEEVFQAPVFETYGSREFMLMGAECDRHQGFHLTSENHIVEIVNDDGSPTPAGSVGNVVVTDLTNVGMPFIRYVNGDRAVAGFERCPCGRGLPVVPEVVGRQADQIETPDGRKLAGVFFPHYLKEFPSIERFLVVQEALDRVRVNVVVRPDWGPFDRKTVAAGITEYLGPSVRLEIDEVPAIPLTSGGKQRVVVSRLSAASGVPELAARA